MAKVANVKRAKNAALRQLRASRKQYEGLIPTAHYLLLRWIAAMTAVEIYAIWERYAERRLTIALTNHPEQFLSDNGIRGMKSIPIGLATTLVRGGGKYFDFRSSADLLDKADRLVGRSYNPFRSLHADVRKYLDTLGAIRNHVTHQSDSSLAAYKRSLTAAYGVISKPAPDEFLNAIDYRAVSPAKNQRRLIGIMMMVEKAIKGS